MSDVTNSARVNVYINGQSGIAELDKLEKRANRLGKTISQVGENSPVGQKLRKELEETTKEIERLSGKLDLNKMSMRQLEAEARRLKTAWKMAEPNTPEFDKLNRSLDAVQKRMKVVQSGLGSFGQAWKNVWDQLKGVNMVLVGMFAGGMLLNWFKDAINSTAELSDQMADVQKTTGMTKREVKELNSEISKIDTRTSAKDLREIAIVAGQLGIAKTEVAGFVESIDKANVALGDEFTGGAQQVAEELGKMRNVLTDIKSDAVDKDLLHIGNALNELSAAGAATAPVVAENANRIGGFGIQAGLSAGQVLGMAAAMQELNIASERGSTAIVKILQKMLTNVEDFAKVAGLPIEDFKKKLDTDLYGAFIAVAQGSKKAATSNTKFAEVIKELDVDGAGASEVMAKFGNNVKLVNDKVILSTESLKEMNSITAEFNLKNQNAGAALDKIGKAISGWFTKTFTSGIEDVLNGISRFLNLTREVSDQLEDERTALVKTQFALNDLNLKQKDRVEIIKELQDKYPEYLSNINAEKISNSDLRVEIEKVNKGLIDKIVLHKRQEEAEKAAESSAKFRIQADDARIEAIERATALSKKYNIQLDKTLTFEKSLQKFTGQVREKISVFNLPDMYALRRLEGAVLGYNGALVASESEGKRYNNLLQDRERLAKELGITTSDATAITSNDAVATSKSIDLTTASIEQLRIELKRLKDLRNSAVPGTESFKELETQVAAVSKRIKELTTSDRAPKKEKKDNAADFKISEFKRYQAAVAEMEKSIQDLYRVDTEIAVMEATAKTDALLEQNKQLQFDMANIIMFGTNEEKRIAKLRLNDLLDQELVFNERREQEALRAEKDLLNKKMKARGDAQTMITNALKTPLQQEIDRVTKHYDELIELAKKYGFDVTELAKARTAAIKGVTDASNASISKTQAEQFEESIKSVRQYGDAFINTIAPLFSILSSGAEKSILETQTTSDKKIAALEREKQRGLITEEQFQKKKLGIEKKAAAEILRMKRKQAINDRLLASFQVGINTAEAIMKSIAASPETFGAPWSIFAGAAGVAQEAAIWAAPLPQSKDGNKVIGGVPDGPSHTNGGINLVNSQTGEVMSQMEGGEPYMILSRKTYGNNGALIDRLLHVSMNEGGRRLTPAEMIGTPTQMSMPFSPSSSSSGGYSSFSNGGISSGSQSSSNSTPEWVGLLTNTILQLQRKLDEPIKATMDYRHSIETQQEIDRVRNFANIGQSKSNTTSTGSGQSGATGATGPAGPAGLTGPAGSAGPSGPPGTDGNGLSLWHFFNV